jgi:hypothetical protein
MLPTELRDEDTNTGKKEEEGKIKDKYHPRKRMEAVAVNISQPNEKLHVDEYINFSISIFMSCRSRISSFHHLQFHDKKKGNSLLQPGMERIINDFSP